jgi:hypothetical protein
MVYAVKSQKDSEPTASPVVAPDTVLIWMVMMSDTLASDIPGWKAQLYPAGSSKGVIPPLPEELT